MRKILILCLIALSALGAGCQKEAAPINSLDDLQQARIGCWPECGYEFIARERFPDAQYVYLDFVGDLVQNLKQHKIDAFVLGDVYAEYFISEGVGIDYFRESLGDVPISYLFTKSAKGEELCGEMNAFIAEMEQSGELEALREKWFRGTEEQRFFTKSPTTGARGTLIVGTDANSPPLVYLKDNEFVGYEMEILDRFCAAYGYAYEVRLEVFETMLADVNLGRMDVGVDAIEPLPEREENMLFSRPTHILKCVMVVNSREEQGETLLGSLQKRIAATLLTENRWSMILAGMRLTIIITLLSTLFGTLLGFGIYMLYREQNRLLNGLIDKFIRLMQGMPQMVMLMFLYYVVFGNADVGGTAVAIIAFAIFLSVAVFIMLKSGTESLPKGQMEAALALGYSERRAFLRFILPQITLIFFPTYQKTIVELLLSTSIVGYVAVQDLTKMGDLIRARTFDAFVPLVIVSAVYLLLSYLLLKATDWILRKISPKNRKGEDILRGAA